MVARASAARIFELREGALRFRFEAHLAARQPSRVRVPLQHLQVVRLRAAVSVVRRASGGSAARRPTSSRRCAARSIPSSSTCVSSHYDSVAAGPGADDDSSGTAALLEAARVLAGHPMPATIVFASFTGEEAGLLGSREFVRRAVGDKLQIVGALNNDMIGWTNDQPARQHDPLLEPGHPRHPARARRCSFTRLDHATTRCTSRAPTRSSLLRRLRRRRRRHRIVSGPRQSRTTTRRSDLLGVENHQLITETSKTTIATLMLLASSPSTADAAASGQRRGWHGVAVVGAGCGKRHRLLRRRLRSAVGSAAAIVSP